MSVSPPNGRLPMPTNYPPITSTPLPTHISQSHPIVPASPLSIATLDGGVYQGHGPPPTNTKVISIDFIKVNFLNKNLFRILLRHLPQFLINNNVQIIIEMLVKFNHNKHRKLCHQHFIMKCPIYVQV